MPELLGFYPHPDPPPVLLPDPSSPVVADPLGVWPHWAPSRGAGSLVPVTHHGAWVQAPAVGDPPASVRGALADGLGAMAQPPISSTDAQAIAAAGSPVGYRYDVGALAVQGQVMAASHPHLEDATMCVALTANGVSGAHLYPLAAVPGTVLERPVFALPWGAVDVVTIDEDAGHVRSWIGAGTFNLAAFVVGIHTQTWQIWVARIAVTKRGGARAAQRFLAAARGLAPAGKVLGESPRDLRRVPTPTDRAIVPFVGVALDPAAPEKEVGAVYHADEVPPDLLEPEVPDVSAASAAPAAAPEPQHAYGGWRCWYLAQQNQVFFDELGIRLVLVRDASWLRWHWEDIEALQFGDASRATLTRVVTVGIAGLGIKKEQVRLAFVVRGEDRSHSVLVTLQYASEAEVGAALQALAPHSEALARLAGLAVPTGGAAGGGAPPSGALPAGPDAVVAAPAPPDAATRLREVASLLEQGLISQDEHDEARGRILAGL